MAREARIEYMTLRELAGLRFDGNPKRHNTTVIRSSLVKFGMVLPIVLDDTSGRIVAGHGRLEVLEALYADGAAAPAHVVEQDGVWSVPVLRGVALSASDASAYVLASNRLVERGGWNGAALREMMLGLRSDGVELEDLGWEAGALRGLLSSDDVRRGGGRGGGAAGRDTLDSAAYVVAYLSAAERPRVLGVFEQAQALYGVQNHSEALERLLSEFAAGGDADGTAGT
jgi:hypothetical protein